MSSTLSTFLKLIAVFNGRLAWSDAPAPRANNRSKTFYVGSREFDLVHAGYVTEESEHGSLLDTSWEGSWNVGHEYGSGAMPPYF